MGSLFGKSETKTVTTRNIPGQSAEERQLLSQLVDLSNKPYTPLPELQQTLRTFYEPLPQTVQTFSNPYLSMRPYERKWGDFLNTFAQRGVLNSTITQNAMRDLGQSLAERGAELKTRGLGLLEGLRQQSMADKLHRLSALDQLQQQGLDKQYQKMFNIWNSLYAGRMGTPPTTITTQSGPSPFGQALGTTLGMAGAYYLPVGISSIGSGLSSLFGGGSQIAMAAPSMVPAATAGAIPFV